MPELGRAVQSRIVVHPSRERFGMKRFVFAPLLALVLGAMAFAAPAAAQDATPIAPDPALCTLTPPTYAELSAYAASPIAEVASPEAAASIELPAGEPVDDATRQAVIDSMKDIPVDIRPIYPERI